MAKKSPTPAYAARKERERQRQSQMARAGRDIGSLPHTKNKRRRTAAGKRFEKFCTTYFPERFPLPFSADHRRVIAKIERAVLRGGLFAEAMPRGSGKTTICECAVLWSILYAFHAFVALIGASADAAEEMLSSIKGELETNELLEADFPEVCKPIVALEGIVNRCRGQLCNGKQTKITWRQRRVVLPTIAGSKCSGAIVQATGITGRIRGMKFTRSDGQNVRPSLVIVDDPQTDESANSHDQCNKRERVLVGAILGLSGPGKKIAGVMPCTIIREDDLAHRMLDRQKHPEWQGELTKMVYAWPKNQKLWDDYAEILREDLAADGDGSRATRFYRARRRKMDAGAVVAWEARRNPDEISGLQHAMNLRIRDERAFFAEYQNEPIPDRDDSQIDTLPAAEIAAKVGSYQRGAVPSDADFLTIGVDVQGEVLFWCALAWARSFTGWVLDYGTWPDQQTSYFTLKNLRHPLSRVKPRAGEEGRILYGLEQLAAELESRKWQRDDGTLQPIAAAVVDAGYQTDVVYEFCRGRPLWMPSFGRGIRASERPMSEWERKPGERRGWHWIVRSDRAKRVRYLLIDTNYWKSHLHERLRTERGDAGALQLFAAKPAKHLCFAEQLTAEFGVRTSGRGRDLIEWRLLTGRDNHWLDTAVISAAAASLHGCQLAATRTAAGAKQKKVKLSELRKRKRSA